MGTNASADKILTEPSLANGFLHPLVRAGIRKGTEKWDTSTCFACGKTVVFKLYRSHSKI